MIFFYDSYKILLFLLIILIFFLDFPIFLIFLMDDDDDDDVDDESQCLAHDESPIPHVPLPITTLALLTPTPPPPARLLTPTLLRSFIRSHPDFRSSQLFNVLFPDPFILTTQHSSREFFFQIGSYPTQTPSQKGPCGISPHRTRPRGGPSATSWSTTKW